LNSTPEATANPTSWLLRMPEHLTARCPALPNARAALARQQERDRDGAYGRDAREHCKTGAPADQVGDHPDDQPAAESSETRSR
jgi:hypothetical protein